MRDFKIPRGFFEELIPRGLFNFIFFEIIFSGFQDLVSLESCSCCLLAPIPLAAATSAKKPSGVDIVQTVTEHSRITTTAYAPPITTVLMDKSSWPTKIRADRRAAVPSGAFRIWTRSGWIRIASIGGF